MGGTHSCTSLDSQDVEPESHGDFQGGSRDVGGKGIEVQNRTDIEIVARAYNSFGIRSGEVLIGKSGPEEKGKTSSENANVLKRLKNQLSLGKISEEEHDVLSKRYKEAMKHEREMDAFQQMKSVKHKKIVMPHGEICFCAWPRS